MAQKFIGLDDAAAQLGATTDQLNQLREQGKLRGYRDGASWKFRSEEIDALAETGLPDAATSDLSLDFPEPEEPAPISLDEIELGDEPPQSALDIGELELEEPDPAASDLSLEEPDEPTVPAEVGDEEVDQIQGLEELPIELEEEDDDAESVLLSETEFGDSENRPPSTIIGKVDLDPAASDLDLTLETDDSDPARQSDVRLAEDVPAGTDISLATESDPEASKARFSDIDELEIDLEAESSRILSPDDAKQAQEAAQAEAAEISDLGLAPTGSDAGLTGMSSLEVGEEESSAGLTGISEIGLEGSEAGLTGMSSLELEEDPEEDVLSDGSDSDITLSSQDSGINIVAPSDSGLALDDVPLDLSGSAMGSSLDLGDAMEEAIALEPMADSEEPEEGDFLLTPTSEDDVAEGDEESSSQVIALDEVTEQEGAEALLGGDEALMGDDFAAGGLAAGAATISQPTEDREFSMGSILGLSACLLLMCLCGMIAFDLVRNIWSWNETYSLNSSLIDSILSLFPS